MGTDNGLSPWGSFTPPNPELRLTGVDDLYEVTELVVYVGPDGRRSVCPPGTLVNGESIPRWLWWLTGHPFQQPGMRASLIHDAACVYRDRHWLFVHTDFLFQLLADGVPWWRAVARALAVLAFGPRW